MGLDMYLTIKKPNHTGEGLRGACGGMFGIRPSTEETNDSIEVGYWRKFYGLDEFLVSYLGHLVPEGANSGFNCVPLPISIDDMDYIIERLEFFISEHIYLDTIFYDEEDADTSEYLDYLGAALESFKTARRYLEEDSEATAYYMCWF